MEIKNAVITDARFDTERGLSAWIMLDYGDSGQGFGGFMLYAPKGWAANNSGGDFTGHFIWRALEVAGVTDWAKLKGCTVRVKTEFTKVHAIGHIVKDIWFDPSEEFKAMEARFKSSPDLNHKLIVALQGCVAVMERELAGLAVIQPELKAARAALTATPT